MFSDHTLMPKEAVRLTALGLLAEEPMTYRSLAEAVRGFTSRIVGPSLELMGTSIELLKYEGLVDGDPLLRLTDDGSRELDSLLTANVRTAANDLNKLVIALKFRFLHLLGPAQRRLQIEMLAEKLDAELARLEDLRRQQLDRPGYLVAWLDHDIGHLEARLAWLKDFGATI